jgi:hypothetical protein
MQMIAFTAMLDALRGNYRTQAGCNFEHWCGQPVDKGFLGRGFVVRHGAV